MESYMFPLLGSLVTGGAQLLGGLFSSETSADNTQANIQAQEAMQKQTQEFNAGQSQIQRDYETQMSNTAYQRSSADMKAAGLNPAMMFGSGSSASTPSVGAASVGTPNMALSNKTSPLAGLGDAVGKAMNSAITLKSFDKMTEEIANLKATNEKIQAETAVEQERAPLTREQTLETANRAQRLSLLMPEARVSGKQAEAIEGMPQWLFDSAVRGGFLGNKASDTLSPVSSMISGAKSMKQLLDDRWP